MNPGIPGIPGILGGMNPAGGMKPENKITALKINQINLYTSTFDFLEDGFLHGAK